MKSTLNKINELVEIGIFKKYAICGGIAHNFYTEVGVTYDLDIMIEIGAETNTLIPLESIYIWAKKNNYTEKDEYIIIEGIPVQFLPAYNDLVADAVNTANKVNVFDVNTYIMKPEYLMAIMLDTWRPKDKERLLKYLETVSYSMELLSQLIEKYKLEDRFKSLQGLII